MAYQVLARKWRPRLFSDVLGQDHIIRTLVNSIKSEKVAHAYLLTGTRGVGKTTIARIFAKAIRCENLSSEFEPCLKCPSCTGIEETNSLDYLEIDGASNNSVDDIRDLIENVQYLPTTGKYKVYVIDEVHMLSVSAFNALLKTLEEPPAHVIFIFATTDPQKLLGTVLSRCQRFDFKNVGVELLTSHLKNIAKKENISFAEEKLVVELAKQGHGSVRDTLSLFDQVISLSEENTITEKSLLLSLGLANTRSINSLLNALFKRDKLGAIEHFNNVIEENIDLKNFTLQVLDRIFLILKEITPGGEFSDSELDSDVLGSLSYIEVMWIYENLMKDFEWSLSSLAPEKATLFSLLKVVAREEILNKSSEKIQIKKKLNNHSESSVEEIVVRAQVSDEVTVSEEVVTLSSPVFENEDIAKARAVLEEDTPRAVAEKRSEESPSLDPVDEVIEIDYPQTWPGFIKFLYDGYKGLAVNVERGNLIGSDYNTEETISGNLRLGFGAECRIFYDYVVDYENNQILQVAIARFLGIQKSEVNLKVEMLDEEAVIRNNFESAVNIVVREANELEDEKRERILSNKYIKDAESLFSSKIDKVVLKTENE